MVTNSPATSRSGLTANEVHQNLREALAEYRRAEQNVVLWFAEVMSRKLFRELGYGSMHQYAEMELGFTRSKTSQFVRLSECLDELPRLKESIASGEISWTKARELSKVATPRTEKAWITEAKQSRSRDLELKVRLARKTAQETMGPGKDQIRIGEGCAVAGNLPAAGAGAASGAEAAVGTEAAMGAEAVARASDHQRRAFVEVAPAALVDRRPDEVRLRFTAEQYARYEAMMEKLRVQGQRQSREELHLAGLESILVKGADKKSNIRGDEGAGSSVKKESNDKNCEKFTRVKSASPYQVVVQHCEACGRATVATSRGPRTLNPATLKAILCDARVKRVGERNKTPIPPRLRKAALERDRYRCRATGCSSARFLAVHHMSPREAGGRHELENLITLCAGCHAAIHRAAEVERNSGAGSVRDVIGAYDAYNKSVAETVETAETAETAKTVATAGLRETGMRVRPIAVVKGRMDSRRPLRNA